MSMSPSAPSSASPTSSRARSRSGSSSSRRVRSGTRATSVRSSSRWCEPVGAFACYRETRVVERLPKTRSGKILRGTMRAIAAGREYGVPSTIDDPAVLEEIELVVRGTQRASL